MITTPTLQIVAEVFYSAAGNVIRRDEIPDREPAYVLAMWDDGYSELQHWHPCQCERNTVTDIDITLLVQTAIARRQTRAA